MSDLGIAYDEIRGGLGENASEFLAYVCAIKRVSSSQSTSGGSFSSPATITGMSAVPVDIEPVSGREIPQSLQTQASTVYRLKMPVKLNSSTFVDIDATCQAVVPANSWRAAEATFDIQYVQLDKLFLYAYGTLAG